jgi:transcriptional regulator with XRE-family HTH domain
MRDPDDLAEEVRSTREAQRLTQAELAARANVSLRTVRNIEAGKPANPATIAAVHDALGFASSPDLPDSDEWVLRMVAHRLAHLADVEKSAYIDEIIRVSVPMSDS